MIKLSNKHEFQFMTASGALAFDGLGWPWEWPFRWLGMIDPTQFTIVLKTLSRHPRKGNLRWTHPWAVVKKLPCALGEGWINSIGLTNPGIDAWIKDTAPTLNPKFSIVVSIEADEIEDVQEMLEKLNPLPLKAVELNLSCPNTDASSSRTSDKIISVVAAASKLSTFPLIAKISYTHDYLHLAKSFEKLKVEAISINSIPWKTIYPEKKSPLLKFGGGGVSGKIIQPYTWKMVRELSQVTNIPIIGPSVWDYEDIDTILKQGAQAVSFGSLFVGSPWKPSAFVKRWLKEKSK